MTVDEFARLREFTKMKQQIQRQWESEIVALREQGYSTRALADPAGVSHMTVWELTR